MKPTLLSLSLLVAVLFPAAAPARADTPARDPGNSVVKIFSTNRLPDLFRPWTKSPPQEVSGTGVVIDGKRILTNAHVVAYSTQIQVQGNLAGDKLPATVESIAPGIDLAVLKLDDESFFDTHPPLPRDNTLPRVKDPVLAYGFPTGGDSLSITKGIVSRIEFVPYNYPVSGLRIQIDAAINPGNSGGPAMVGDKMIGLAFSHLQNAENIGYIIPCEEIDYFLKAVKGGRAYGKPGMYEGTQTLENGALRSHLKVDRSVKGMVVNHIDSDDPSYPLRKWDIITRIGDADVNDQGKVNIRSDLQVFFPYLIQREYRDGIVPLTVVRGGKPIAIRLPVFPNRPMLIRALDGAYPRYFILGPVVFSVATADFLNSLNSSNKGNLFPFLSYVGSPMAVRRGDRPAFPGEEIVVISSPFFPHRLTSGYGRVLGQVVSKVNGIPIRSLDHMIEVIRDARDRDLVFEFPGKVGEDLVFRREAMIAATDDILADNGIRSQGTPEELAVWTAKPAR